MTAAHPNLLTCPECGSTNTQVGGSGNGMCFECAHMWDPATVTAIPRARETVPEVVPGPDWFDAPTPTPEPPNPHDFPETWSGLAQYRAAGGSMSNEQWWADIMGSPPDDLDPAVAVEPEPPIEVQAALMLATEIVAAGITASYTIEHPEVQFMAPTGYLPTEKAMLPIVEQACAVAIGMMIDASDFDAQTWAVWLGIELEAPTQGDTTTEESNEQDTSTTE